VSVDRCVVCKHGWWGAGEVSASQQASVRLHKGAKKRARARPNCRREWSDEWRVQRRGQGRGEGRDEEVFIYDGEGMNIQHRFLIFGRMGGRIVDVVFFFSSEGNLGIELNRVVTNGVWTDGR
jgi:hypothetical protein